jgi:tetratricopeptide (TPR) repeat protein
MTHLVPMALLAALSLAALPPQQPRGSVLAGSVIRENQTALAGVTVRLKNIGETTTTGTGEFQISLPSTVLPGDTVVVEIIPSTWVLKNVYNQRLVVPARVGDAVTLVVARRGSLSLLDDDTLRRMIEEAAKRQTYRASVGGGTGFEPKAPIGDVIAEQATQLGVPARVVTEKLDAWARARRTKGTPYDVGLAAFYSGQYGRAAEHLRIAKQAGGAELLAITLMLGQSHQALMRFADAGSAFREALALEPHNVDALIGTATNCLMQEALRADGDVDFRPEELAECDEDGTAYVTRTIEAFKNAADPDLEKYAGALAVFGLMGAADEPEFDLDFTPSIEEARQIRAKVEALATPHVGTLMAVAIVAMLNEEAEEALQIIELALKRGEKALGRDFPERPALLLMKSAFAESHSESARLLSQALTSVTRLERPDQVAEVHLAIAAVLEETKSDSDDDVSRIDKRIEGHFLKAIEAVHDAAAAGSPALLGARSAYGGWLLDVEREADSARQMHLAYDEAKRVYGADHWMPRHMRPSLIELYDSEVYFDALPVAQGIALYKRYIELLDEPPADSDELESVLDDFVEYLEEHGRAAEARPLKQRLELVTLANLDRDDPSGDSSATFRARKLLSNHKSVTLQQLYVDVCRGVALPLGVVSSAADEELALSALRSVAGVRATTSKIAVIPVPVSDGPAVGEGGVVTGVVELASDTSRSTAAGARVVLGGNGRRFEATTDPKGAFRFDPVPAGTYTLVAVSGSLKPYILTLNVTSAGETTVTAVLRYPRYGCDAADGGRDVATAPAVPATRADFLLRSGRFGATVHLPRWFAGSGADQFGRVITTGPGSVWYSS